MDRFFTILIWIILIAGGIGLLRYGKNANTLATTFFDWFYKTTELLAGLAPAGQTFPKGQVA